MTCGRVVIINEGEIAAVDSVQNLEKNATGRPAWKIVLKAPDNFDWQTIVNKAPDAQINDLIQGDASEFKLRLNRSEDFDDLFKVLTKENCIFREITPIKATLEDVFLKITLGEERKENA
jgi:ABC-2 type transport system ATP-binding protein